MASVAFHHFNQLQRRRPGQAVRRTTAATRPASRRATSSSSSDVVAVNLWFLAHPEASGIFNLGSGRAAAVQRRRRWRSSTPAAPSAARRRCRSPRWSTPGSVEYIDFPPALVGKYQCFTEADLGRLRAVGCASSLCRRGHGSRPVRRCAARPAPEAGPGQPRRPAPVTGGCRAIEGCGQPAAIGRRLIHHQRTSRMFKTIRRSARCAARRPPGVRRGRRQQGRRRPSSKRSRASARRSRPASSMNGKKSEYKDWTDLVTRVKGIGDRSAANFPPPA